MRFWNRRINPQNPPVRTRSAVRAASALFSTVFGQRPMFSRPDDEDVTRSRTELPPEVTLDTVTPSDRSPGNSNDPLPPPPRGPVIVNVGLGVLSTPPTSDELDETMGITKKTKGFIGVVNKSTTTSYLVVYNGSYWFYELLTRAT